MRARVLIPYIDRETGIFHRSGEVVDLEQSRFDEIAAGGFIEPLDDPAPAAKKRATRTKKKG